MQSIKDYLTVLENTPGKNDKKDFLTEHKANPTLKRVFMYGLDGSMNTGIKAIPEYIPVDVTMSIEEGLDGLEPLYLGKITGNAARSHLANILSHLSVDDADVITRIVRKKLNVGMSDKSANAVYGKNFIPVEPYMRCELLNADTVLNITSFKELGYAVSECKMDGQYLNIIVRGDNVTCMSRNAVEYDFLGKVDAKMIELKEKFKHDPQFDDGIVFMGECLVLDDEGNYLPRTTGNGIVQKGGKGTISENEAERIAFVLWDVVPYQAYRNGLWNVTRSERRTMLLNAIADVHSAHLQFVRHRKVHSIEEALDYNAELMEEGQEGTVLKCEFGIWKSHTSPKQLKVKMIIEVDLKIVGFIEGEGKRKGKLGAFMMESADGLVQVNVGTGLKEKDAEWTTATIWEHRESFMNTVASVKATGLVKDKKRKDDVQKLFLPVFLEFRPDKDTADDLPRILDIIESSIIVLKDKLNRELK